MVTIDVDIVANGVRCHTKFIPPFSEIYKRFEYPLGTCPYYRQLPRGDGKICVLFQQHVRGEVPLSSDSEGFALRTPRCLNAEARSRMNHVLRIDLPATATSCENKPLVVTNTNKDEIEELKNNPHTTCSLYREYPGGNSLCTLGNRVGSNEPRTVLYLRRKADGFTTRTRDCLNMEVHKDKERTVRT